MDWGLIDRWNKNYSVSPFDITIKHDPGRSWNQGYLISPPNYTLYTYFRLRDYFIIFLVVLAFHILAIFISKWKTSNIFVTKLNFLDKLIHCIENTNIVSNVQGREYLVFISSRSLKTREKYTISENFVCLSLYIFWGKCVYFSIFEWWKCPMDFLT